MSTYGDIEIHSVLCEIAETLNEIKGILKEIKPQNEENGNGK